MTEVTETSVTAPDGRVLRVIEAGDPGGRPVLWHHGTPSSSLLYEPWIASATQKGARLIGYDRPGYGGSSPQPGRTIADAAADVATIARAMGIDRLGTMGLSGGGPHALACAALLPDLVTAAVSIAGLAPPDAEDLDLIAGMGESNIAEFNAAIEGREKLEPMLREFAASMLSGVEDDESLDTLLSEADRGALTPEFTAWLDATSHEGLAPGIEGWVEDDIAFVIPWGFDLQKIEVPVQVWQGEQDLMVPFDHGKWLAAHIPGVDARLSPDEGHLTIPTQRFDEILDWVLEKSR